MTRSNLRAAVKRNSQDSNRPHCKRLSQPMALTALREWQSPAAAAGWFAPASPVELCVGLGDQVQVVAGDATERLDRDKLALVPHRGHLPQVPQSTHFARRSEDGRVRSTSALTGPELLTRSNRCMSGASARTVEAVLFSFSGLFQSGESSSHIGLQIQRQSKGSSHRPWSEGCCVRCLNKQKHQPGQRASWSFLICGVRAACVCNRTVLPARRTP